MSKKKLSTKQVSKMVVLAASGASNRKIGRELQVSPSTVGKALSQEDIAQKVMEARERLSDAWVDVAERAITHITDEKLLKSSAPQLSVIGGIATEKSIMLRGGPGNHGVQIQVNVRVDPSRPPEKDPRVIETEQIKE